jgi:ABC-2 type transport system ATP-binding protein
MLQANALTKHFGALVALDALTLRVEPGEVFCLLGANGAGKTTTINLFLGFLEPTSGTARVDGIDVAACPLEARRRVAYIPEQVTLYRNLTGLENLRYFTDLAGHRDYTDDRLLEFCRDMGLPPDDARRRVTTYSKGMRQKIGLAVAMAKRAGALLLDEPTSGLDPKAANEFTALLTRLSAGGVAVLMATHDLFNARQVGTRTGIMKRGKLVTTLTTAEIGHVDLEQIYLRHMQED